MTRQIAEIAAKREGIHFHLTSLKPIRPENGPTPREEKALKAFEKGTQEIGQIVDDESNKTFFYMAPLKTEKECLPCHAEHGYKEGDIAGWDQCHSAVRPPNTAHCFDHRPQRHWLSGAARNSSFWNKT